MGSSCQGLLFPISMLPTQPTTHEYCQGGPRVSEGYLGGQVPKDESRRGDLLHDAPKSLALASKDSSSASHCLVGVDQPLCSEALCPHGNSSFWQAVSEKPQVGMSMRAYLSVHLSLLSRHPLLLFPKSVLCSPSPANTEDSACPSLPVPAFPHLCRSVGSPPQSGCR